jgi:hypothetical protein
LILLTTAIISEVHEFPWAVRYRVSITTPILRAQRPGTAADETGRAVKASVEEVAEETDVAKAKGAGRRHG